MMCMSEQRSILFFRGNQSKVHHILLHLRSKRLVLARLTSTGQYSMATTRRQGCFALAGRTPSRGISPGQVRPRAGRGAGRVAARPTANPSGVYDRVVRDLVETPHDTQTNRILNAYGSHTSAATPLPVSSMPPAHFRSSASAQWISDSS
jgi:hypothetical protein